MGGVVLERAVADVGEVVLRGVITVGTVDDGEIHADSAEGFEHGEVGVVGETFIDVDHERIGKAWEGEFSDEVFDEAIVLGMGLEHQDAALGTASVEVENEGLFVVRKEWLFAIGKGAFESKFFTICEEEPHFSIDGIGLECSDGFQDASYASEIISDPWSELAGVIMGDHQNGTRGFLSAAVGDDVGELQFFVLERLGRDVESETLESGDESIADGFIFG